MYMLPPAYSAMSPMMMGLQNLRRRPATQRQPGEVYRPRTYGSMGTMTPFTDGQDTPAGPRWAGNRIPTAPMAEPMTDPTGLGPRMNALAQMRQRSGNQVPQPVERGAATGAEVGQMEDYLRAKYYDRSGIPHPPWRQPGQPEGQATSADADAYVRALQGMKEELDTNAYMKALPGMMGGDFSSELSRFRGAGGNSAYDRAVGTLSVMNDAGVQGELARRKMMADREAKGTGPMAQRRQQLMDIMAQREAVAQSRMLQANPLLGLAFGAGGNGALPSAMQFGAVGMNPSLGLEAYANQQRMQQQQEQNRMNQLSGAAGGILSGMMADGGEVDPQKAMGLMGLYGQMTGQQPAGVQQQLPSVMQFGGGEKDPGELLDQLETSGQTFGDAGSLRKFMAENGVTVEDLHNLVYEGSGPLGMFGAQTFGPMWSSSNSARRRAAAMKMLQLLQGGSAANVAPSPVVSDPGQRSLMGPY